MSAAVKHARKVAKAVASLQLALQEAIIDGAEIVFEQKMPEGTWQRIEIFSASPVRVNATQTERVNHSIEAAELARPRKPRAKKAAKTPDAGEVTPS